MTFSKIPDISLTAVKIPTLPGFPNKWSPCYYRSNIQPSKTYRTSPPCLISTNHKQKQQNFKDDSTYSVYNSSRVNVLQQNRLNTITLR